MLIKFSMNDVEGYRQYYERQGYVIIENLLKAAHIDEFLNEYEHFKHRHYYLMQSQDTNRPEALTLSSEGFLEHAILDPKDLVFASGFVTGVRRCVTEPQVAGVLQNLSGVMEHIIWQTMFFDKSTGTIAHQDHYYLDSDPPGKNIAVWFSLEDIQDDAGVFYVIPGSHRLENVPQTLEHATYVNEIDKMIQVHQLQRLPCPLKKGDVLFWHPSLIHGAFSNANPQHSRKSFTAHYLPMGYKRSGHTHRKGTSPESVLIPGTTFREWKRSYPRKLVTFGLRYVRFALNSLRSNKGIKYDLRRASYKR